MSLLTSILLIVTLAGIGAFFSIAEISLAAARKVKLEIMASNNNKKAADVLNLQQDPSNFFTVSQIGLNCVGISTGMLAEPALSPYMGQLLGYFYSSDNLALLSVWSTFALVTTFMIVFSDIIPKRLAMLYPETICLLTIRAIRILVFGLKPLVWFFNGMSSLIFKVLRIPETRSETVTTDEVYAMVDAGAQSGALLHQEHTMIEHVLNLESRNVLSAMTPRDEIIFLDTSTCNHQKILDTVLNEPYSKLLVCDHDLDHLKGYIDAEDILKRILKNEPYELTDKSLLKQPLTIPDGINLWEALEQLNLAKTSFSVVVNEYGTVVGILTIADITAILMNKIVATDIDEQQIVQRDEHSWLIDGNTPIDDVAAALHIDSFPQDSQYETIAGFMIHQLRRIPHKTDTIIYHHFKFEVIDIKQQKISQLLVSKINGDGLKDAKPSTDHIPIE